MLCDIYILLPTRSQLSFSPISRTFVFLRHGAEISRCPVFPSIDRAMGPITRSSGHFFQCLLVAVSEHRPPGLQQQTKPCDVDRQ